MTMKNNNILFCLLLLFLGSNVFAQGWRTELDPLYADNAWKVVATHDGGYMVLDDRNNGAIRITYLDNGGDSIWTKVVDTIPNSDGMGLIQKRDSTFSICGRQNSQGLLIELDKNGNPLLKRLYPTSTGFSEVRETPDNGLVFSEDLSNNGLALLKVDSIGDSLWFRSFIGTSSGNCISVENTLENGFIACGSRKVSSYDSPALVNVDSVGDTNWTFLGSNFTNDIGRVVDVAQYPDSSFLAFAYMIELVGSSSFNYGWLLKLNAQGDTLWTHRVNLAPESRFQSLALTSNGGFAITAFDPLLDELSLVRFDTLGHEMWTRKYPDLSVWGGQYSNLAVTQDGGFVFSGFSGIVSANTKAHVVKTDSLGRSYACMLAGSVFQDSNGNCIKEAGEVGLAGTIVRARNTQTGAVFYGFTDASGYYEIGLDTGIYEAGLDTTHSFGHLWGTPTCSPGFVLDTFALGEDAIADFPRTISALCPLLGIDMGASFFRRCFSNRLYIQYQNFGTSTAYNPHIEVRLGSDFSVDNASIPWSSVSDTLVVFQLDSLLPGQLGTIHLDVTLDSACTQTILGEARCASAHIFPDTTCAPINPIWDGSSLAVTAKCIEDSIVRLAVYNRGSNNMTVPGQVIIVEDNILRLDSNVLLNAGDSVVWWETANGSTWYIQADQSAGHPGNSFPSAFCEGCGTNGNGGISTGYALGYPLDNGELFRSIYCAELQGSYDPNEKVVHPAGQTQLHLVEPGQQLDYTLRFQNTGTDTAFTVVIVDTLPPELAVGTILSGAASHPHTFELLGKGVARWTFANISLPDSNVNEGGSHGFVRFSIDQVPHLPYGSRINNAVEIFFDFNAPVLTDTAFVTLGKDGGYIILSLDEQATATANLSIYPNPSSHTATIDFKQSYPDVSLEVYDLQGRLLIQRQAGRTNKLYFQSDQFKEGVYLYRVLSRGELLGNGRLTVIH